MALEAPPRLPWRSACCQAPAVRGGAAPSPEPPPTAQQAVGTERGFPRLPGGITGQTPHQLPSQPENCSRRRSGCRLLHRMLRSLRSLRRPPSTPEKRTFQLCLDTRIDITAPLGDDGSDTTAHSCSVVASAATSTVHYSVATSEIGTHSGFALREAIRPALSCHGRAAPAAILPALRTVHAWPPLAGPGSSVANPLQRTRRPACCGSPPTLRQSAWSKSYLESNQPPPATASTVTKR